MEIGGIQVMLNDQLQEEQINQHVRQIILKHIMATDFKAHSAMLGKAKEGIGGFRLVIMSADLKTAKHTIVVPGMAPWK